jgi:hypothetical protein
MRRLPWKKLTMRSEELRKHHIRSFKKISISSRLSWAFMQSQFFAGFMDAQAKRASKTLRRNGKKYFKKPDLA